MRYTYLFTQVSRYENGNLVPITDKPYEFVFTFGKKIDTILDESPDNTVLLTKDMWKEHPATNKEILPTVCFSTASQQGFRRPLVMTKDADKRAGVYEYKEVVGSPIDLKKDQCLSDDIRTLTETFVNGVRAVNNDAMPKSWVNLENANVKYLMSYVKSYVYIQLLQDRDNRGKERSEEFLKNVLQTFFSLIPDSIIEKFDKGLEAHDKIRAKLEGVPEDDDDTIKALLDSQGYFNSFEDYKLFVVLHKYILSVKNIFNRLVWVMYRSKIGLVSLKNVKQQLSVMFGFVIKVQDNYEQKDEKDILEKICSGNRYYNIVGDFLRKIDDWFDVKSLSKVEQAALCYKFQNECDQKYLNSRFKCWNEIKKEYKSRHCEEFRDLCLQFWKIEENNSYRPCKCEEQMEAFSGGVKDLEIWKPMSKKP